jgi:hypothetical protein
MCRALLTDTVLDAPAENGGFAQEYELQAKDARGIPTAIRKMLQYPGSTTKRCWSRGRPKICNKLDLRRKLESSTRQV